MLGQRKIKIKIKSVMVSFVVIFVINLYFLYLIAPPYGTIMGIAAQDFALVVAILWGTYYWAKLIKRPNPPFRYGKWVIAFVIMAVLSSVQSNLLYGQSFLQGFAPQRWTLVWLLMYFILRKLIYYKKLKFDSLIKMMVAVGFLQLTLFISQYLLGDENGLLYVNSSIRNGRMRYYFGPILLDFLFLYLLDKFNTAKGSKRIFYFSCCALILFETMVVQQFRLTTMGLILCLGLYIVFVRTRSQTKLLYFVVGAATLGFLFSTPLVQNVLDQVLHSNYDGGMLIRSAARLLYFETLQKHPILGGGYPSNYYQPARQAAGMNSLMYLYDNGVFGFMYIYGMIGIVWAVSFWAKLIRDGRYIQKRFYELAFLLFPVFFIITCMNELHWYWEYGMVVFSLYMCLMETKIAQGGERGESNPY